MLKITFEIYIKKYLKNFNALLGDGTVLSTEHRHEKHFWTIKLYLVFS